MIIMVTSRIKKAVNKIDLKRSGSLHVVCKWVPIVLFVVFFQPVFAWPLPPGQSVTIYSEFPGAGHFPSSGPKKWIVRSAVEEGSSSETWDVFPAGSDAPFCRVEIFTGGASGKIIMTDLHDGRKNESDNGLFILPGYPAPCNVLPVHQLEPEKFYDEKRNAGGRLFIRRYRVFRESVPWATALNEGWLKAGMESGTAAGAADSPSDPPPLWMLTVMDDTQTPVVRQLWRKGGTWWIYEETPFKRSWRVE